MEKDKLKLYILFDLEDHTFQDQVCQIDSYRRISKIKYV